MLKNKRFIYKTAEQYNESELDQLPANNNYPKVENINAANDTNTEDIEKAYRANDKLMKDLDSEETEKSKIEKRTILNQCIDDTTFVAKNYLPGIAKIATAAETGQWKNAAYNFYKTFLSKPEDMKRYRDIMLKKYNPIYYMSKVPIAGWFWKPQIWIMDNTVDATAYVMEKVLSIGGDKVITKALRDAKGDFDKLSKEQQSVLKNMLLDVAKYGKEKLAA